MRPEVLYEKSRNLLLSTNIHSGEEFDYVYVQDQQYYNLSSFNRLAVFVLPPSPKLGFTVNFSDKEGSTLYHKTMIHRNGNMIMGEKEHMYCDIPNILFSMIYVGGYVGWMVTTQELDKKESYE